MLSLVNVAARGLAPTRILAAMVCSGTWITCSMLVDSLVTMTCFPSGEMATPSGSRPTWISANCSPVLGSNTDALASSSLEM